MSLDALIQGECDVCGMPGIPGLNCSDPDCRGTMKNLQLTKNPVGDEENDRYDKDLLESDDDDMGLLGAKTISLDDAAEEEDAEEERANNPHEDL